MTQNIENVFEGLELSEDAREQIKTIFTAAVNEGVRNAESALRESVTAELSEKSEQHLAYLQEQFDAKTAELSEDYEKQGKTLVEQYEAKVAELETQAEAYLTESVKTWISENQVALVNQVKLERMEAFVSGMRTLFAESSIDLPEASYEIAESVQAQVAELQESNSVLTARLQSLAEESLKANKELAFIKLSEGLTDLQVERLRGLSEDIEAKTAEEFSTKLNTLKEAFMKSPESKDTNVNESENKQPANKPADKDAAHAKLMEDVMRVARGRF